MCLTICLFSACHDKLWDAIDDLDVRVARLEELCKEMNTNIVSIQTIVNVVQSGDYITGVTEIKKDGEVIGYTITFGQHDPITIYHGQDGKDGADGKDGQDGQNGSANAPVIGVAQDTDGVYYWTLNGEWLLDDNGNKLPVSGKDGQNGTNGSNGQDGADGKDGQDGEDGKDGTDGQDGTGVSYTGGRVLNAYRNITLYAQWGSLTEGVDMGLSVKWASVNIGANKPEEYGDYFAWGEIEPKNEYHIGTYKWCEGKYWTLTKYNTNYDNGNVIDNKIVLDKEDDAAVANWGGSWRMPTVTECIELNENCVWTPITQNGVKGYQIKSKKNGNTIFLPAAGYYSQGHHFIEGQCGCWSSSLVISTPNNAYAVSESTNALSGGPERCQGLPIRPVCP